MAVSKRNTVPSQAQELPLTITRVSLYARVSTLNGQDPEMQLCELREYASYIRNCALMKNVRKTELNGTLIQRTTTVSRRTWRQRS